MRSLEWLLPGSLQRREQQDIAHGPVGWQVAQILWKGRAAAHLKLREVILAQEQLVARLGRATGKLGVVTEVLGAFAIQVDATLSTLNDQLEATMRNLDLVQRECRNVEHLLDKGVEKLEIERARAKNTAREAAQANHLQGRVENRSHQAQDLSFSFKMNDMDQLKNFLDST